MENRVLMTWETVSRGFIYEESMSQTEKGGGENSISRNNGH